MPEELQLKNIHYGTDDLADYFAGEMPDEEAAELERHMAECGQCRDDAGAVSARSYSWISWTSEAPSGLARAETRLVAAAESQPAARDSAHVLPFKAPKSRVAWRYLWPAVAIPAAAAAALLFFSNQSLQEKSRRQLEQLAKASIDADVSRSRVGDLEQEVARIRDQLATVRNSGGKPAQFPDTTKPITIPAAMVMLPLTIQSTTLGSANTVVQELSLSAEVPSVTLEISLPETEIRPNAVIDAALTSGDVKIQRTGIAVDRSRQPLHVALILSAAEAKSLLNRQTRITLTDRGHALIGAVTVTLRVQ